MALPASSFGMPASAPASPLRRLGAVLLLAGLLVGLVSGAAGAQPAQRSGPQVEVVEVRGTIDSVVARYLARTIAEAQARGPEVIVLQLDSGAGLNVDVEQLVAPLVDSTVPIAAWVGPAGARATGAAAALTAAAHVVAVAPVTLLGAAAPVDLAEQVDGTADAAAQAERIAALAAERGRDVGTWSALAAQRRMVAVVPDGADPTLPDGLRLPAGTTLDDVVTMTESELVAGGVVDVTAHELPDVLAELDGREVVVAGALRTLDVDTSLTDVRFNNLGLGSRILHTVASPALAYLLVVGGLLCLLFEVFQPGFGVAGITGLALVALGVYAVAVLPASWLAFALLVGGVLLLALDLAIAGLGVPTAAGTVAMALGSWWLFPAELRPPAWLLAFAVLSAVGYFVVVMTTVLRSQGNQAMAGAERVVGQVGVVRSMLNPEGHIFVGGALWRARAPESVGKVKTGTTVRVLGMNDRLTLDVEVVDADEAAPV